MDRLQEDWQHQYRATPLEYPISTNEAHSTYDQFIQLRDTLIMSNKYYADNAWRSLIIGVKTDWTPTDTIEIWKPNIFSQLFEPDGTITPTEQWTYIASGWHTSTNPLSCEIVKTWRYIIQHKEQFINLDDTSITRILAYINQHHWNQEIPRAVFDREWNEAGFFSKMTSFGYVECDLEKWDWLEFIYVDQNWVKIPDANIQQYSNWWMVEYKDLAYNI